MTYCNRCGKLMYDGIIMAGPRTYCDCSRKPLEVGGKIYDPPMSRR